MVKVMTQTPGLPVANARTLRELLDRHPVLQRSVRLRNPYVDPMNAIQVDLLARYRAAESDEERARLAASVARSIAGIAAALRNTG